MPFVTIKPVATAEKKRLNAYWPLRREYLKAHPLCQITLARFRIDEKEVLSRFLSGPRLCDQFWFDRTEGDKRVAYPIPYATQIHHRNKSNGRRRNIQEFWMSAASIPHRWVEQHKDEARAIGLLCPINARPDGTMPDGSQCLPTAHLIYVRSLGSDETQSQPPQVVIR